MAYTLQFAPGAEREFRKLPRQVQVRLRPRIDALAEEPRPVGAEALSGMGNLHRIRVGDYRIIYTIEDQALMIVVLKLGHRREVYRRISG